MTENPRRGFIKKALIGSAIGISMSEIVEAAYLPQEGYKAKMAPDATILFQGDSITDAGRKKDETGFNNANALGSGYAFLAAAQLLQKNPSKGLKIYNKGISGNKVYQLAERWEQDCLHIQPDVLSILIGVNDYWHKHAGRYDGTIEVYRKDYISLLERTKKALPKVQLVIGEPFALKGIKAVDDSWYPAFDAYRQASKEIAGIFNAIFIPYQTIFEKATKHAPGVYWTHDGVHPSVAGAQLMAEAWLKAVN